MDIPIILVLLFVAFISVYNCIIVTAIINDLEDRPKEKQEPPKVTDPFYKPKEVYSSTPHIVVPKTPTEIRNQNFDKIKEGIEYGDIKREE